MGMRGGGGLRELCLEQVGLIPERDILSDGRFPSK